MARHSAIAVLTSFVAAASTAGPPPRETFNSAAFRECGTFYAGPIANPKDAGSRGCEVAQSRRYRSNYNGYAKQALDLESEACFVPDRSYELLDHLVEGVRDRVSQAGLRPDQADRRRFVEEVSSIMADVLDEKGFALYIPTATLGDALAFRQAAGEPPRHVIDCDTASLILLEIAQSYGISAALVDITLASGAGHNYVRWQVGPGEWIDWDTNGRGPCHTPSGLPSYEGRALSKDETFAYLTAVRAGLRKERGDFAGALADYRSAIELHPEQPGPYNNVAWMIATREFKGRTSHKRYGVEAANRAVAADPQANYFDTLACAQAYAGNFGAAVRAAEKAVAADPTKEAYARRLAMFRAAKPKDCTGLS